MLALCVCMWMNAFLLYGLWLARWEIVCYDLAFLPPSLPLFFCGMCWWRFHCLLVFAQLLEGFLQTKENLSVYYILQTDGVVQSHSTPDHSYLHFSHFQEWAFHGVSENTQIPSWIQTRTRSECLQRGIGRAGPICVLLFGNETDLRKGSCRVHTHNTYMKYEIKATTSRTESILMRLKRVFP